VLNDDFEGGTLFPASNWWNQDISQAPVDANSNAFIDFIGRTRSVHPDFGPPPYGIPYIGVGGNQPRVPIAFVWYPSESDTGIRIHSRISGAGRGEVPAQLHRRRRARRRRQR
jgi:hypothetical protein